MPKRIKKLKPRDVAKYFMYCAINETGQAHNYFNFYLTRNILKDRCKWLTVCAYCAHIDIEKERLIPLFKEKLLAGHYAPFFKSLYSKGLRLKPKNIIDRELKGYLDIIYESFMSDTVFEIINKLHNTNAWKKAKLYKPLNKKLITQDFIKGWIDERKDNGN